MRTTAVAAALLAAVAAGASTACSGDAGASVPSSSVPPADIPACNEVYVEGNKVTDADFGVACTTETGRLLAPRPIRIECEDDRVLLWNDLAWGYVGEPMALTPEDAPSKMPEDALSDCLAQGGTLSQRSNADEATDEATPPD
ncbi:MAG TPA: hypothetical protein VF743_01255 [Acidimicrobiales bacterium]